MHLLPTADGPSPDELPSDQDGRSGLHPDAAAPAAVTEPDDQYSGAESKAPSAAHDLHAPKIRAPGRGHGVDSSGHGPRMAQLARGRAGPAGPWHGCAPLPPRRTDDLGGGSLGA
jgi:hypothetical protein